MAKVRIRERHPISKNKKITVVHSIKGAKLHRRLKIMKIVLGISLIVNGYLVYLLKH